jgi:hypothetical protein
LKIQGFQLYNVSGDGFDIARSQLNPDLFSLFEEFAVSELVKSNSEKAADFDGASVELQ